MTEKELVQELFEEIKDISEEICWTRGVILSRENKTSCEKFEKDEYIFKVEAPNRNIPALVKLWLKDQDWQCDCKGKLDPCEHTVASMISLKKAIDSDTPLSVSKKTNPKITYHFNSNENQELEFIRCSTEIEQHQPIKISLLSSKVKEMRVNPSLLELTIDKLLGNQLDGIIPPTKWLEIMPHISQHDSVYYDNILCTFSPRTIGFECFIEDQNNGIKLTIRQDHRIKKFHSNGLAKTEEAIHVVSRNGLDVETISKHQQGNYYPPSQFPYIVSELLPKIRSCIPLINQSHNLPKEEKVRPRLAMETKTQGKRLHITPVIIYGDPEIARVVKKDFLVKPGCSVPVRDLKFEKKILEVAKDQLRLNQIAQSPLEGDDAILASQELQAWKGDLLGDSLDQFQVHKPEGWGFQYSEQKLSVEYQLDNSGKKGAADLNQLISSWDQGQMYTPLVGGGWIPLPKDWLNKYGAKIKELLESSDKENRLAEATKPLIAKMIQENGQELNFDLKAYKDVFSNFQGIDQYKIPNNINATLRDYQVQGVKWLLFLKDIRFNGLLADDMGLGKTLQTISILKKKSLVIAPTSVINNWKKEINRFRPDLKATVYHGAKREFSGNWDVLITTYAILRQDEEKLSSIHWDFIVLDEAQNIKNPHSKVSQCSYRLNGKVKLCLTGTPIENHLEELWSQFNFLNPGYLGSYEGFKKRYSQNLEENSLATLKEKIKPFILRRKKIDVAKELPPKTETIIECELSDEEQLVYDSLLLSKKKEVLNILQGGGSIMQALELLLRLRQASCSAYLVDKTVDKFSSKIRLLLEHLKLLKEVQSKALVFSQWTSMLDLIESQLKENSLSYSRIDGKTKNRQSIVDEFQSDNGPEIMLISLKAGGAGLNLTAADQVYIMDPWWNPAVEDQAADRAYRIGQTKPVIVKKIVAKNTVEEKILQLQERKKQLAESILDGKGTATKITKDDLLDLLS